MSHDSRRYREALQEVTESSWVVDGFSFAALCLIRECQYSTQQVQHWNRSLPYWETSRITFDQPDWIWFECSLALSQTRLAVGPIQLCPFHRVPERGEERKKVAGERSRREGGGEREAERETQGLFGQNQALSQTAVWERWFYRPWHLNVWLQVWCPTLFLSSCPSHSIFFSQRVYVCISLCCDCAHFNGPPQTACFSNRWMFLSFQSYLNIIQFNTILLRINSQCTMRRACTAELCWFYTDYYSAYSNQTVITKFTSTQIHDMGRLNKKII